MKDKHTIKKEPKTQYNVQGTRNVLADCLSRLVNAKLTDHDYKSKGQEFGILCLKNYPPISSTQESTDMLPKNGLRHSDA